MKKILYLTFACCMLLSVASAKPGTYKSPMAQKSVNPHLADTTHDAWGYSWLRSDESGGPVYNWMDSTAGWQKVNGLADDNHVGPFNLGFTFPYYWYSASKLYIGSNGWISFSTPSVDISSPFTQFPAAAAPNDVIAPLGSDLDLSFDSLNQRYHSGVYFWTNNVDSAIVSWVNVVEYWSTPPQPRPTYSFQVILTKADTGITFQYGNHSDNAVFASETNITMGIENNTGQVGLNYFNVAQGGPIDTSRYTPGIAVSIKKTAETGFQVIDGGIIGGLNEGNGAMFYTNGSTNTVNAFVKNYGNSDLFNIKCRATITRGTTTVQRDTVVIDTLPSGSSKELTFPKSFVPAQAGAHLIRFNLDVTGDLVSANNTKSTEVSVLNVAPNAHITLAYENGTLDGTGVSWTGGGGIGNEYTAPFSAKIESAYVYVQTVTSGSATISLVAGDGPDGIPGTVLASHTIATPTTGSLVNKVYFGGDNITIDSGKFYIGAATTGSITWGTNTVAPISFRSWEITSGWAPYRERETRDVMIRAVVAATGTAVRDQYLTYLPKGYELEQNYPNPFNPSTTIKFTLAHTTGVSIVVYDVLGNEVKTLANGTMNSGVHTLSWNGTNNAGGFVPTGIYFYRVKGNNFSETKKMMLLK